MARSAPAADIISKFRVGTSGEVPIRLISSAFYSAFPQETASYPDIATKLERMYDRLKNLKPDTSVWYGFDRVTDLQGKDWEFKAQWYEGDEELEDDGTGWIIVCYSSNSPVIARETYQGRLPSDPLPVTN